MESITSDILKLWRWFFFSKLSNIYADLVNTIKLAEDVDGFEGKCVWACCEIFCQSWQQYMWSAVNVVKSGPEISDPTKRHDTQLNFFPINGTLT